jgi:hypothetical protein
MNVVEQRRWKVSVRSGPGGRCVFWLQSPVAVPVRFGSTHSVSIQAPEFLHVYTHTVPQCTVLYVGRSRSEAWGVHGLCGAYWSAVPFGSAVVEGSSWGWSWKGGAVENGGRGAGFVTTSHASR